MVSSTKQTTRRRQLRSSQRGRWNKKLGASTPVFPVHPPGYDAAAPDAKPAEAKPATAKTTEQKSEGGASR